MRAGKLAERVEIHRRGTVRNERGATADAWTLVGLAWVAIRPRSERRADGPGEVLTGAAEVELRRGVDIRELDVLRSIGGSYTGQRWEVRGPAKITGGGAVVPAAPYTGDQP